MKRFFFDLQGGQYTRDDSGLPFKTDLEAFRAAKRLAGELTAARPDLHGNTCIVVRHGSNSYDGYYISI